MKLRVLPLAVGLLCLRTWTMAQGPSTEVTLTSLPDRVRVAIAGQPFTEYIFAGANHPYCWPILASDGTQVARDFPMKTTPGEDHDHPHHRGLWFAHSSVDGIDFWNEDPAGGKTPKGTIVHEATVVAASGMRGRLETRNRWLSPTGALVCTDDTVLGFFADIDGRYIDIAVTLHARPDAPLHMGDNKDGVMAIRLAQWMTLPHKYEKHDLPGTGHIETSTGATDAAAWGKRADWCDYSGTRDGKTYGVAIFEDRRNLRHPTWWMARDYGLFGANPFGQHDYENLPDKPHAGDYTIPAGGSLTLAYRFFIHGGGPVAAQVAYHYVDYVSRLPRPSVAPVK